MSWLSARSTLNAYGVSGDCYPVSVDTGYPLQWVAAIADLHQVTSYDNIRSLIETVGEDDVYIRARTETWRQRLGKDAS